MATTPPVKPDPDPTLLTTESLLREINHLKELTEEKLKTQATRADSFESRLDHKYVETADAIKNLRDVHDEKFNGLAQLALQTREDNQTRLDAAFKSANDTRDKIEESLTKQIDALSDKAEATNKATNEKIDRLTSRFDTGEGRGYGVVESKHDRSTDKGQSLVTISIVIALSALAFTVVMGLRGH